MERHGFIHDILDVKLLILYVMSLVEEPVNAQTIYELCFQDECLSYFDVYEAIPQMVDTGHLEEVGKDHYRITEKGRETEEITEDSIAFSVKEKAKLAVEKLNQSSKRDQFVRSEIRETTRGDYVVTMALDDLQGPLMNLQLTVPTLQRARKLETAYRSHAEGVYKAVMLGLLDQSRTGDTEN